MITNPAEYRKLATLALLLAVALNPIVAAAADKFAASNSCAQCHAEIYAAWRQSDHSKAMQPANAANVLGNFNNVTIKFHGIATRLFREGDKFKVATVGADGKPGEFEIGYTFGHYPLQQYLVGISNGHLQALNVAWDSRPVELGGQRWFHLQADEDIDPEHPFFWMRHFQNANSRCIECHNTDVSKNFDTDARTYATTWSETGVGCESCHGPAGRHVAMATANELSKTETGFRQKARPLLTWVFRGNADIASPAGTNDDSYIDTCGGCHSRRASIGDVKPLAAYHDQYRLALLDSGLYFADGQIQDEVFVLGSFLQSKMAQKGVTCANCHDAHSGKTIAEGNALCAQCHKPAAFDSRDHHRHPPDSAGAECVNCHMPERLYMGVDWRRDHGFSIPNPERSSNIGAPNACTNCHQDKENAWASRAMTEWGISRKDDPWTLYNHKLELGDSLTFRDYARQREPAVQAPIQQATLISKLAGFPSRLAIETASRHLASPDPLIRRAAISALQAIPLQVRWQLLQSLMVDPVKSVRLDVASALADVLPQLEGSDAEQLGRLIDEYRELINYNADTPGGQLAIGNLELRLGYSILAEQAYQMALDIEPQFVPALINLADLYRAIGSDGEASALLQRAVEIAPDSANSNHAYGLYLVRSGKQDEALKYLETATRQQDANPRHVYVYAVALDSRGETEVAMKVIELASQRWVNNIDLYFLQVSYMDKTGNTDDIHRYLSTLVSIAFSNPQVKAWANKYGSGKS